MSNKKKVMTSGNLAFAEAMRQINPDVVAAYPITPSTEIPMRFADFVANGKVDSEYVAVESEHSAISACVGASISGARVMTASSANGVALMHEIFPIAASFRAPIVFGLVNRSLGAPVNIHCDHSDSMPERDSGWVQIYCEDAQEVYDSVLLAVRLAEDPRVLTPVFVCQDGFITSHAIENIELVEDDKVKAFVGEYKPVINIMDKDHPVSVGPYAVPTYYMEAKRQQAQAMIDAKDVIRKVGKEFGEMTGRSYGLVEEYMMDDAEVAIVIMGSSAGTAKEAIQELRAEGHKVGLIKIRAFRPFPKEEIIAGLSKVKAFAVMDKADSFSALCGPIYADTCAALYTAPTRPLGINYIYGLGGRDVRVDSIKHVFAEVEKVAATGEVGETYRYLDVRE